MLVWISPLLAVEKIYSFDSDIVIQSDGTINVTETIVINAEGRKIRRGIYRDFPTVYFGPLLTRSKVGFEVESIMRNGYPEPYDTKSLSNGIRIYIGNENAFLSKGKHKYIIKYTTDRQIAFLDDFDEFYWNVTGNDWDFVIDQVNASVTLPDGALESLLDVTGWTGYFGQEFKNLKNQTSNEQLLFYSTKALSPNQGMTIKIKIAKGYIANNTNGVMDFFRDNFLWVLMLIGLVSLMVFYYLSWDSYGRDPEAGILMPLFYPPKDLSPAAVRYIHKEKTDNKGFTAALISMAVKGVITIKQTKKKYTITRTELAVQKLDKLSKGEKLIYKRLLARNKTFTISKTYSSKIGTASNKFNKLLKDEYKDSCFKNNKRFGFVGILLSISILFIMYMHQSSGSVGFVSAKTGFFLVTIIALVFIFKVAQQ
ncbi:MAG: DUF2207 domain-containing protein [Proteobacteria bacterium]|nr:DUF2207 domain-containing protein [Pseudomonadota bacterium]